MTATPVSDSTANHHYCNGSLVLGDRPQFVTCVNCQERIYSTIKPASGKSTWAIAGVLGGFTGMVCAMSLATTMVSPIGIISAFLVCLPCVSIPFCVNGWKDVKHYCPNCGNYLGTYTRYK